MGGGGGGRRGRTWMRERLEGGRNSHGAPDSEESTWTCVGGTKGGTEGEGEVTEGKERMGVGSKEQRGGR